MVAGDDDLLARYRHSWDALRDLDDRLERLRHQESSARQRADYLRESIQRINRAGTTVLLAEQNAYAALRIAHRAYVLESGRIVREGRPAELLAWMMDSPPWA